MLCITIATADKWATVLEGKLIGVSKHKDYSLFHWKARDVKTLKVAIEKFIFVEADGKVSEVILATSLKDRGQNYKTAKRDGAELTDDETRAVKAAVDIVLAAAVPKTTEAPKPHVPAADVPKIVLSPEGAAVGLADLRQATEATQTDVTVGEVQDPLSGTADTIEAGIAELEAEEPMEGADVDAANDSAEDAASVDDPLALVKPTRKKRRH